MKDGLIYDWNRDTPAPALTSSTTWRAWRARSSAASCVSTPTARRARAQEIEVGPLSGRSNVLFWLECRGIPADEDLVDRVFRRAKASATVLTEQEILTEIHHARPSSTRLDA